MFSELTPYDEYETQDKFKVRTLPPMDFTGKPKTEIQRIGNTMKEDQQWGRILSTDGICSTIMHGAAPNILLYREVDTDCERPTDFLVMNAQVIPLW